LEPARKLTTGSIWQRTCCLPTLRAGDAPGASTVRRKEVSWKKVAKLPLIGPHKDNPIRERLDASLLADGITLSRVHEVYLPLTMVGMVEAGLGVAVMTTAVSRLAQALGLVIRTTTGPVMRRKSHCCTTPIVRCRPPLSAFGICWCASASKSRASSSTVASCPVYAAAYGCAVDAGRARRRSCS
jgi:DNA-binding transcriptional LysR family regulator